LTNIPRRSFIAEIDGTKIRCRELSIAYIKEAMDSGSDNATLAFEDSLENFTPDTLKLFGNETAEVLYSKIVDFTFETTITTKEGKEYAKKLGLTFEEFVKLDRDSKVALKGILDARDKKPKEENSKKKPFIVVSPK